MDLREEVYLHEDDMHDDHLPPQATASPAVQHSLLDMCDGGYPLPIQVLDKRTANRIYKTLTQLHPEFPSPTPALYLHNLIATQRDEIIALWQSSTQNLLPNHGYRKTIEAQIAHNAIYKVDKAMYAFLLTTVLLGKGALLTTDQQKIAMQPTQNKHAYLLEQLALVPRPTRAEELMQYRRQVEQLGILSPFFVRPGEREILGPTLEHFTHMGQMLRMHPTALAKRPMLFDHHQKEYHDKIYRQVASVIPEHIDRWSTQVAEQYCYRMQRADMIKQHKHYQEAQKAYGASPFEGAVLMREMLVVEYFQKSMGDNVCVKRASNYDDKEYGIDMIAYTPTLGKIGFFDVTFDQTKIDEKRAKVQNLLDKKIYEKTEFFGALHQAGRQPMCHITGGVIYINYDAFLRYVKEHIEALVAGSTQEHLTWIANQYPHKQFIELYPLDKQAKRLLTKQ